MTRADKFEAVEHFSTNIGKQVVKHSGKPFKSGEKIGTVTGVVVKKDLGGGDRDVACYTFAEDESFVECFRCKPIEE